MSGWIAEKYKKVFFLLNDFIYSQLTIKNISRCVFRAMADVNNIPGDIVNYSTTNSEELNE
jgi:hypothetical protein